MVKDFLVIADLGAAGNLLRNLMLLGKTDWPLPIARLARILNQYPDDLKLNNWLEQEYRLRFWRQQYGLDLSDNLDHAQFEQLPVVELPRVWLNHSAFWQQQQFDWFSTHCNIVYVAPSTQAGLEWQIRSYVGKKTLPLLHDFCFEHDRDQQRQEYIQQHGINAYYKLNVENMKEIINQRQQQFWHQIPNGIKLELLLTGSPTEIHNAIVQATGLKIEIQQIEQVVTAWRKLHWTDTLDWEYHYLFQQ
jgi:hypothetical protein